MPKFRTMSTTSSGVSGREAVVVQMQHRVGMSHSSAWRITLYDGYLTVQPLDKRGMDISSNFNVPAHLEDVEELYKGLKYLLLGPLGRAAMDHEDNAADGI